MIFWINSEPLLRNKQHALDIQDLQGLWQPRYRLGSRTIFAGLYSRIDQVFMIWGLISAIIFVTAQFMPISWSQQAVFWSLLTLIGTAVMVRFTWFWARVEQLRWVVLCWTALMLVGLALTDLSIFLGWGNLLIRLCPLWLSLNAIGYLATGWGMRSRTFLVTGLFHLLGITVLPYCAGFQFLATGVVTALSLLLLAQWQWDMRLPIEYSVLTPEQKQFNQLQHQQRQLISPSNAV